MKQPAEVVLVVAAPLARGWEILVSHQMVVDAHKWPVRPIVCRPATNKPVGSQRKLVVGKAAQVLAAQVLVGQVLVGQVLVGQPAGVVLK